MIIDPHAPVPNKAEVLYMTPNGQLNSFEGDGQRRGKSIVSILLFLSNHLL
jgi:hypothetical protein